LEHAHEEAKMDVVEIVIPREIEEDLSLAVAMATRALAAITRIQKSDVLPGGALGVVGQTLSFTRGNLEKALGFGNSLDMGLADLIGMRAHKAWLDEAYVAGSYGGITVYRYDGVEGDNVRVSTYSAKEIIDPETGYTFWFRTVESLVAMLVAECGVSDRLEYEIATFGNT
jgi:hypothetical protein